MSFFILVICLPVENELLSFIAQKFFMKHFPKAISLQKKFLILKLISCTKKAYFNQGKDKHTLIQIKIFHTNARNPLHCCLPEAATAAALSLSLSLWISDH